MNHCIAIGFSDGLDKCQVDRIRTRAEHTISALTGSSVAIRVSDRSLLVVTDVNTSLFYQWTPTAALYCSVCATYTRDGERLASAKEIFEFQRRHDISGFADVVPPLAVVIADEQSLSGISDSCGLQHIYYTQSDSFAAISTSSLALARLVNADFDLEGLAVFSQVGHLIGSLSFFESIHKISHSSCCEIHDGRATIHSYAGTPSDRHPNEFRQDEQAVSEGVEVVRECVQAALKAFPDAKVEVSGGIDSRLILAAIPRARRRDLHGVTIGSPTDPDYLVAQKIAENSSFHHELIQLDAVSSFTRDETLALLRSAARWSDYSSPLFSRAMIEFASREIGSGPRMGGANGEFARGFYYPAQPRDADASTALIDRLIEWRICVNAAVAPIIFCDEYRSSLKSATRTHILQAFSHESGDWLRKTDEFYLHQRMERWAGSAVSAMSNRRAILSPFFDPRFITWARHTPPRLKRGSSAFASILEKLDPSLSAIRLDSGIAPRELNDRGIAATLSRLSHLTRKTTAKVIQKVRSQNRGHPIEQVLCDRLLVDSRVGELLPRVMNLDFIDPDGVLSAIDQPSRNRPSTIGFLLTLEWALHSRET